METNETTPALVIVAWTCAETEIVHPGRPDIGRGPTTRRVVAMRSATWCAAGDAADVAKAHTHAKSNGWIVYICAPATDDAALEAAHKRAQADAYSAEKKAGYPCLTT